MGVEISMKPETAKEIFEKYNPAQDVVRCPNGRAHIKKLLDSYARAAVELYGIISREELLEIFNGQNSDKTTVDEIYILLLPLVRKDAPYGFYKDCIVDAEFFDDFSAADKLLAVQGDKPRYIPPKPEFLQYSQGGYDDNSNLLNLRRFLLNEFGHNAKTAAAMDEILDQVVFGGEFHELGPLMSRHNLEFSTEQQMNKFIELVMLASNNRRLWENKGHTPSELFELTKREAPEKAETLLQKRTKVGRNDPCPCGSGKKFKKCCGRFDDSKTAQLSAEECKEFYELWFGLMGYVNDREEVIREKIKPEYPNAVQDDRIYPVREVLWEKPQLIDEYIRETKLPQDQIDILKLWRTNFKKGTLILVEYLPDYAVAVGSQEGADCLYGIKGISNSLANTLRRPLPTPVETVLLPYRGKIIYDSYLQSFQVGMRDGARKFIEEIYDKAKSQGIITSLE